MGAPLHYCTKSNGQRFIRSTQCALNGKDFIRSVKCASYYHSLVTKCYKKLSFHVIMTQFSAKKFASLAEIF